MEKIYTVSLTESELKLFSEFLSQKENSAVDGVLTPAALEGIQSPALGGPNKGILGTIEKTLPSILKKFSTPSSKGGAFMRFKRNRLAHAVKGSFRGYRT